MKVKDLVEVLDTRCFHIVLTSNTLIKNKLQTWFFLKEEDIDKTYFDWNVEFITDKGGYDETLLQVIIGKDEEE